MTEANSGGGVVNCCVGCERPIMDKYYPCIDDQIWHQDCLRCVICRIHLVGRCFVRNGQYFCRSDFVSPRCPTCLETILPTDLVRLLGSVAYHADCFRCVLCARCLATGDEYRPLGDGVRFICLEHEAPTLALPAAPTDPRPCGAGTPQSSSRSDGVFDDIGGGGVSDEVKHEREFLLQSEVVKEAAYYGNRDSYASTEAGLGHFVSSDPEQEREVDSPMYAGNLDADDRSEECGLELGEAEAETEGEVEPEEGSKAPSGGDEAAGSPASNEVSAAATNAPLPTQGSIEGGGNSLLTKRRGPRTTIKAKQLDTLKQAFATTPKPSRHIREQLAQETGLSMRVIQVWFQNRRSKERRMKQLSALGVRRPFFPQQQHHSHHHHHHQPVRRVRIGGGGGSVTSRDVCAFGPEDLPAEVMAELLHVPPPLSLPQPSAYQNGLFCVDTQREFYNAMASEAGNALPVGSSLFAYGPSPPPPPPLSGYGNAFPEGGVVYPSSQEAMVKKGPLSPDRPLPCEQDLAKTSDDQTNDSSVYFSDGGGYAVGKTTLSPLLEPFPQLAQSRISRGAAFHHNHHHSHHHHLQASGGHQLAHFSPVKSQAGASDQLAPAGVLECSW